MSESPVPQTHLREMKYEIVKIERSHWWNMGAFPFDVTVKMEDGMFLKTTTSRPSDENFRRWIEVDIREYYAQKNNHLANTVGSIFKVTIYE